MSQMIAVPVTVLDKSTAFAEMSSILVKRALDEVEVHRSAQTKAASLAPQVLDLMLKTGSARPEQKDTAAAMLGGHDTTLTLLKIATEKLADLRDINVKQAAEIVRLGGNAKSAGDLGRPVADTPAPASGSSPQPYVGARTDQVMESDRVFLRSIGKG